MVVVNTSRGPIDLNTPEDVAAALNAGQIDVGTAGQAQIAIAGGPANSPTNNPGVGPSAGVPRPGAGGLTAVPTTGVQTRPGGGTGGVTDIPSRSLNEILADFRAGRLSEALAFDEMFEALRASGLDDVAARDGVRDILRLANEGLAASANRPGGPVSAFGESDADRATAFQGELGRRFQQGLGSRTAGALGRQFGAIEPAFQFGRGLGNLAPSLDFRDFLSRNLGGGGGGLDLGGLVRQAAGLFGADLSGQDQNIQRSFRQDLLNEPNQGFNLALQSELQGIPLFLQGSFRNLANRAIGRFRSEGPVNPDTGLPDTEGNPFLPEFVRRGGFGGF